MSNSISNYNFEDSDKLIGFNHRINITMASGRVYNIAAEENSEKIFLPKCIKKIFWAKVHLSDSEGNSKTFLVNRNSLAKRTGTSDSLAKFALKTGKKDKSFDSAMRILHQADKIAESMEKDHRTRSKRRQKAGELVKIIEKNKDDYRGRAEDEGGFVEKRKGHTFVVRIDPNDPNRTNFYIKQAKVIGSGGFKTVHPLMDYETQETKYAISIQRGNKKRPSQMDHPRKGFEIAKQLESAKNVMNGELLYEEGVTRDENGKILEVDKNAASYLMTKLYQGTFSDIVKLNAIGLKPKLMLFSQILQGVSDMHAQGLVHCDLKNANVLYKFKNDKFKIKIIDLDLAKTFEERMENKTSPGTAHYKPPEALLGRGSIPHPDKLDSWSLGIMLYQLCEGDPAFFKKQSEASRLEWATIATEGAQNLEFKKLPENDPIRDIIHGLLTIDPALRLSVDDAKAALLTHIQSF